jgi:hypothetical protein
LTFNGLYGVTAQKIELFITTAVRTSDPKRQKGAGGKDERRKRRREDKRNMKLSNEIEFCLLGCDATLSASKARTFRAFVPRLP